MQCSHVKKIILRLTGQIVFWELNEGATKCIQTDPQTWSFTWAFADNENKLVFDGFDEYVLVELTSSTLKLRQAFVENGVTYTFDDSYGHWINVEYRMLKYRMLNVEYVLF
jgi:hypothetical protein